MASSLSARSTTEDVLRGRDLSGQNMLITGCNAGIGFETARALAAHGAHVIVACRDQAKAEGTAARIRQLHAAAKVTPLALDLSSLSSVRAAAAAVPVDALHVLICNAGLFPGSYAETEQGIEHTVGVCHFGHFLLTLLLLDRLRRAAPARVVMVASESHRFPFTLDFARFPPRPGNFKALVAYGQAKLCNVLFANELTRRYQHEGIYANSLHPGSLIGTSIFRDSTAAKLLALAVKPFTKSIEQGAATTVYCATAPELARSGGNYYVDCHKGSMSKGARDELVARTLWEMTAQRVDIAHA